MVSGSILSSWLRLLRFLRASVACHKGFTVVSYVSFAVRTGSCRVVSGDHLQGNSGARACVSWFGVCVNLMGLLVLASLVF